MGCLSVAEHLFNMHKALGSVPRGREEEEEKQKRGEEEVSEGERGDGLLPRSFR